MTIKLKQRAYKFGSHNGWKGEFAGMVVVTIFLFGIGIAVLAHGIFGNPQYKPGKEQPISARAAALILGSLLTPFGMFMGYQAVRTFQERHKIEENEYTLPGVTSYEVLSESEALQKAAKTRKRWFTY